MPRYIFITGGVVSSLGKGLASAAVGALLQARGSTCHSLALPGMGCGVPVVGGVRGGCDGQNGSLALLPAARTRCDDGKHCDAAQCQQGGYPVDAQ